MKILKKKTIASSPKIDATETDRTVADATAFNEVDVPAKKVNVTGFQGWMEKMKEEKMKWVTNNFRQRAEQVGVPPERVGDFKYWLRENKYE